MTLPPNAPSELAVRNGYICFQENVVDSMPQIIQQGHIPAGIALLIDLRQSGSGYHNLNISTGDSVTTDETGGVLLTLDSFLLRQLTPESPLFHGALELEQNQYEELKADKEHSLYLTPTEMEVAHEKGYVSNSGIFVSQNKTVAKIWNFLKRGREIQSYAQMVSEASRKNDIMQLYFIFSNQRSKNPIMRSLVLDSIVNRSYVISSCDLTSKGAYVLSVPDAQSNTRKST